MGVYQKTFSTLKSSVSSMLLNDAGSLIWTDTLLGELVNREYIELLELAQRYGDFLSSTTDISVVAGTQEYNLPADFGTIRKVVRTDDNIELKRGSWDDYLQLNTETQTGYTTWYYLREAYNISGAGPTTAYALIGCIPISDINFTMRVKYHALPSELSVSTDVPRIPGSFHELIILGATMRGFEIKGMMPNVKTLEGRYVRLYRKFEQWLSQNRQQFKSDDFVNVYGGVR